MLRDGTAENSEDKICKGKEQNHKRIIEVKKMERYMILIRTDGTGRLIRCDDGDTCKLETLQQLVCETICAEWGIRLGGEEA